MATKKQRRRRDKTFRHEYALVTYDEEGNEVEVDAVGDPREEAGEAEAGDRGEEGRREGRLDAGSTREPPLPSWRRSLKRGGLFGGLIFILVVFVMPSGGSRAAVDHHGARLRGRVHPADVLDRPPHVPHLAAPPGEDARSYAGKWPSPGHGESSIRILAPPALESECRSPGSNRISRPASSSSRRRSDRTCPRHGHPRVLLHLVLAELVVAGSRALRDLLAFFVDGYLFSGDLLFEGSLAGSTSRVSD